jgi:Rieske Fe-S protein
MNRKEFISACALGCLSAAGLTGLLPACTPAKYLQVKKSGDKLKIARSEFVKGESGKHRRYIIVKTEDLAYPVIVYRFSDSEYSALLLRCTHQGTELTVNGDLLSCAAHGSEFGRSGEVVQGPADESLKSFRVDSDTDFIYIQLT